jgi:dihydrofolate reductase
MGRVIYSMNVTLDGYVASADGGLDWSIVDDEIHSFWNDQVARTDAEVYGRRLHEVMAYWRTAEQDPDALPVMREFARIWNSKPKIVFSRTLERLEPEAEADPLTRLERTDIVDALPGLQEEFPGDLSVGGPTIAAELVRRDLVDVYIVAVHPVVLGSGIPFWPSLDRPLSLRLTERREFRSGIVALTYERVREE